MGAHPPLLRRLRHAACNCSKASAATSARLRPQRLSAHLAGHDGAGAQGRAGAAGHARNSPYKRYTALAGFLEAGESVEEAIHREVFEEVGLRVHNLQYFGSQSWPFPHSLMIAYTADYLDGEIRVDERNRRRALVRPATNGPSAGQSRSPRADRRPPARARQAGRPALSYILSGKFKKGVSSCLKNFRKTTGAA
jgi:ADP-ribose pyrophosphatase YjhB (NUDIX family)